MDDLDALLADLETTTSHLARRPVLLTDPLGGLPPPHPASTPAGDPPRPPPPPYGPVPINPQHAGPQAPGGDTEQLYSTVQKTRPPRPTPGPPGLGELDRLLRDLNATHSSIADEILAQFPPLKTSEGMKKKEAADEAEVRTSPSRSGTPPGPPTSATSATQELDKLMASLSDFHLRRTVSPKESRTRPPPLSSCTPITFFFPSSHPQPPQKKGVPEEGNLDSMLVLLQSDLSRQGVPTGAKGVCGSCQKPIAGKVVRALGCAWHPEHFVCARCGGELGGGSFFEKDGAPYCPRDYGRLFSPRCARCAQPILDKMVTALDKNWHPEHFCCVKCGQPFGEEGFLEKDGQQYCRQDFAELFSSRCQGCGRPILEGYIAALEGLWHPECFVCRECFAPFVGGSFFEDGGHPYCERHFHARRGSLCRGCGEPIAGRCVTAMAQRFHPEHFVCAFCLRPLSKGTFQEQEGKPYCQPCFLRLFG
ncbi:transforming growth factor beta-1-induced transcript 1 protein isoform X1 [Buteo buteo]|uniref:transforming growth factor beta-1-induced transcript 1 protein isoform X1 n=1 Tax=Buteo buteo TaxID=30397 RepID=UPI003EBDB395